MPNSALDMTIRDADAAARDPTHAFLDCDAGVLSRHQCIGCSTLSTLLRRASVTAPCRHDSGSSEPAG